MTWIWISPRVICPSTAPPRAQVQTILSPARFFREKGTEEEAWPMPLLASSEHFCRLGVSGVPHRTIHVKCPHLNSSSRTNSYTLHLLLQPPDCQLIQTDALHTNICTTNKITGCLTPNIHVVQNNHLCCLSLSPPCANQCNAFAGSVRYLRGILSKGFWLGARLLRITFLPCHSLQTMHILISPQTLIRKLCIPSLQPSTVN